MFVYTYSICTQAANICALVSHYFTTQAVVTRKHFLKSCTLCVKLEKWNSKLVMEMYWCTDKEMIKQGPNREEFSLGDKRKQDKN